MNKTQIITGIVLLLTAFALGRFTTPVKTITETKIVEVDKKTDDKKTDAEKHKKTTVVEVDKPDGTKEITTTTTDDVSKKVDDKSTDNTSTTSDTRTETVRSSQPVTLSLLTGVNVLSPTGIIYGGAVTKPVLGPITIGVFGMANGVAGASVGLSF